MEYLPRVADALLQEKLPHAGAVCIRGPKWCGKTSTALQRAKSALFLQDPDTRANNLRLALEVAYDYVSVIAEEDISRVDGVQRSADYARLLMAEYGRCTSTMASMNSIRANVARHAGRCRGRQLRPTPRR